ncbi:MAG: hypothetical protein VR78_11015 [Hoeflea sp. BRH_c9]|nr:MAG: hypothetical protein VR78_11015 [Hoeflea sp. BRH_c9]
MSQVRPDAASTIKTEALATVLGVTAQKIRDYTRAGVLEQTGNQGEYFLIAAVSSVTKHLRETAAGRTPGDEILKLKTQKLRADAAKATLQAQALQGSVIPRDAIANRWTTTARIIRSTLLAVPARAAARLNLSATAREELEAEIHAALEDLAENGLEQVEIHEFREAHANG